VYQQRYTPPLIPPRGEVNAADAFDIGSFDEEDTKGDVNVVIEIFGKKVGVFKINVIIKIFGDFRQSLANMAVFFKLV
jgi:hypothetical protein